MVALAVALICGSAFAGDTGRGVYTTPSSPLTTWLNNNDSFSHNHGYDQSKYKSPLGLEADVTLWEQQVAGIPMGFGTRSNYDFNNGVWGCFVKADVNLAPTIRRILGR